MNKKLAPLAEALNNDLLSCDNCAFEVLSERGKRIFFPSKGILGQSAEAKSSRINATIGTAVEEDGSPLCLECVEELVNIPSESFLYAPSFGVLELRKVWKNMLYEKNPSLKGLQFSLPVICGALTHALSISGYLFVNEGDEIVIPNLNWDNYELVFQNAYGAEFTTYQTFADGGYNIKGFEDALFSGNEKKIVLLNFPNNPTGYTVTENEALALRNSILKAAEAGKKLVVVLDDAYFGLVYENGVLRESLFPLLVNLHKNVLAVKLDAPTKEDYVWSFRIGFMTFGIKNSNEKQLKALETKTAGAIRGNVSNCSGIAQNILLKAFQNESYLSQKKAKYEILLKRYKKIREIIKAHPEYSDSFEPMPFNSGYFMCVKPIGVDAETVRKKLVEKYSTGTIVLSGLIRLAFSAIPLEKLDALFANIHAAVEDIKKSELKT